MKTTLLLSILLIVSLSAGISQTYRIKNYSVDQGLPSSEVFQVLQDRQGFVWFATSHGVSRFNGYEFQNFDMTSGLPNNSILEMYEDFKGRIWFISLSCELSYFYNDRIVIYPFNDTIKKEINSYGIPVKSSFYVDKEENVYLSVNTASILCISKSGIVKSIGHEKGNYRNYRNLIFVEKNKILCDITPFKNVEGITIIKNNNTTHIPYFISKDVKNRSFALPYSNGILFYNDSELFFIQDNKIFRKFDFKKNILWLSREDDGNLWISVNKSGIYLYKNPNDFSKPETHLLKDLSVSSVIKDKEGAYWFTTLEEGVFYLPSIEIKSITTSDGIKAKKINTLDYYKNSIWFAGDYKDIYYWDHKKLSYSRYFDITDGYYEFIKWHKDKLYMSGNLPGTMNIFSNKKKQFHLPFYGKGIFFNQKANDYYLFYHGLVRIVNDSVIESSSFQLGFKTRIFAMCQDKNNTLLLGTETGLYTYNGKKIEKVEKRNKLLGYRIQSLIKDTIQETLWIASNGGGLILKTPKDVIQFTKKDGLPDNSLNSMVLDTNYLWIATNKGLSRLDLRKTKENKYNFINYTTLDGLLSNEINKVIIKDSIVYLATNKGLCYFNKNKIHPNSTPPPIYITNIAINETDTVPSKKYILPYNKDNITIGYVGLSYKNAGKIEYKYKLEGANEEWIITQDRLARFPLLPPGDYRFIVKAINEAGVESAQAATFSFTIKKPFWQTALFYGLIALLFFTFGSAIFYLINRVKIRELNKRHELEKNINKFRQQALSAQMNPHFIFNSLNSVQKYILENDRNTSNIYLSKVAHLMRLILSNSQFSEIPFIDELEALKLYVELEQIRFSNNFTFKLEVDKDVDLYNHKIPPLIIQPFVENAIHHGLRNKKENRQLLVKLYKEDAFICIVIEDNGIGRKKAEELKNRKGNTYKSLGTEITKNRLEIYRELYENKISLNYVDLTDNSGNACGTRVVLKMT